MYKTKAPSYNHSKAKLKFFSWQYKTDKAFLKISFITLFICFGLAVFAQPIIPDKPQPPRLVNDLADILKPKKKGN